MDYFKLLPVDITSEILSRLPTELVLECKLVCTSWRRLVRNGSFCKLHLYHHPPAGVSGELGFLVLTNIGRSVSEFEYFEYNENHNQSTATPIQRIRKLNLIPPFKNFSFVGSINGLICFSESTSICICNPITREYVMLPNIKRDGNAVDVYTCRTSFGYVSLTDEYKVVGFSVLQNKFVEVHVYTLGSGSGWRNLVNSGFKFKLCDYDIFEAGIFANGALYWMGLALVNKILTFDMDEEKFCEHLPLPPLPPEGSWLRNRIGVLDGVFYIAVLVELEGGGFYDIWLLENKNSYHEMKEQREEDRSLVWSKGFRVDCRTLLAITKSDGILTYVDRYLNIYDTKASTSKRLMEFKEGVRKVLPYKKTFVSLKELGEEDTKTMEPVEGDRKL